MSTSRSSGNYVPPPARGECPSGKLQYANRKQAKARARALLDNALGPYRCDACGWFHIGHKPQRVRNGEVDKAAWLHGGPRPVAPVEPAPASFTPADMARLAGPRTETAR